MNKKILLITNIFPPVIGGPATFIDKLGYALANLEYKVTVICWSAKAVESLDGERPFRIKRIFGRTQPEREIRARLIIFWEMLFHDIILVNGLEKIAYQIALITKRPYLVKVVGDTVWENARNMGDTSLGIDEFQKISFMDSSLARQRDFQKAYLNKARFIIVPSIFLKDLVKGWGISEDSIYVIRNGVFISDYEKYSPQRRKKSNLEVAFVGRLTNWKGIETLLLAACHVSNMVVTIIGEGPEKPILSALVAQLGLQEKVQFAGTLDKFQLNEKLSQMDVLVLGSSYEGLSHTLIEASAIGLACIASNCGGNSEFIEHGKNGFLFEYGDVRTLAYLLTLLRDDENRRLSLARGAKENSKSFDFTDTVNQTINVLLR